jgi:adenine-specific DNA-methyltransferase
MSFNTKLINILKADLRFVDDEGELVLAAVQDRAWKLDRDLVRLLLSDKSIKDKFFNEIEGHWIFGADAFLDYVSQKNFLDNSYTRFRNRIGLTIDGKFLRERGEVALTWPYKDCVLEGGQTKEEESRRELFFNELLAQDEINRLLDPKVLSNFVRYSAKGKEDVKDFKRDKSGVICENLIIKGNNLLALHTLKTLFAGRAKLIYIDPPYNTGGDSFGYNDNYNHSTWLTFMKNRLDAARDFLSRDGLIFVHCDKNEFSPLKILLDEIYGRENYIDTITTVNNPRGRDYGGIANMHEYIHVYAKDKNDYVIYELARPNKEFDYEDQYGGFDIRELRNRNTRFNESNRPNLVYPFYVNPKSENVDGFYEISLKSEEGWVEVYPAKSQGIQTVWRWGKETSQQDLNKNICARQMQDGRYQIVEKYRKNTRMARSVWWDKEVNSELGTKHLRRLFGRKVFDYPKPETLMRRIIEMATKKDDLVIDFCLGSGTTASTCHKLGRRYIGIEQIDNYVDDVAVPRLCMVLNGEDGGISQSVSWRGGGEFIYCSLMKYNEVFMDRIEAAEKSRELLKIWQDMTEGSFIKWYVNPGMPDGATNDFEAIGKEENGLEKQKRLLAELLDKNQLYVNLSEIDDVQFNVSKEDKALNKAFYGEAYNA